MDVRDDVEGKPKVSLFSTNEILGKCWRFWTESPKGMIKTGDLENRNKIGVKEQGVLCTQWEDLKKQFAKKTWLEYYPENEVELKQASVG